MKEMVCNRCNKIFYRSFNFNRHMNRKKKCQIILLTDIKNENAINGDMDIDKMSKNNDLIDIKNKTPISNDLDIENLKNSRTKKKKEEKIIKLEKLLHELKDEVEPKADEQKAPTIINNNITNNTINNIVNNIQINKYGDETIDYVTPAFIRKIKTDSSLTGLLCLTNHIYCNSKHMDNCSVIVIDISHDRCKINVKEYWEIKSLNDIVENNLVRTSCRMSDAVENAAADQGRKRDEQGFPILDDYENRLIDCYNKLNDEENYSKQIKEIRKKHRNCLIDHTNRNKEFFDRLLQKSDAGLLSHV